MEIHTGNEGLVNIRMIGYFCSGQCTFIRLPHCTGRKNDASQIRFKSRPRWDQDAWDRDEGFAEDQNWHEIEINNPNSDLKYVSSSYPGDLQCLDWKSFCDDSFCFFIFTYSIKKEYWLFGDRCKCKEDFKNHKSQVHLSSSGKYTCIVEFKWGRGRARKISWWPWLDFG